MSCIRAAVAPLRQVHVSRALSTSVIRHKTLTDSVKETADTVNKKVGKTLASGLDSVEHATEKTKETLAKAAPAKGDAHRAAETAQKKAESTRQSANQALGSAAGKARDAKDQVKKNM